MFYSNNHKTNVLLKAIEIATEDPHLSYEWDDNLQEHVFKYDGVDIVKANFDNIERGNNTSVFSSMDRLKVKKFKRLFIGY